LEKRLQTPGRGLTHHFENNGAKPDVRGPVRDPESTKPRVGEHFDRGKKRKNLWVSLQEGQLPKRTESR